MNIKKDVRIDNEIMDEIIASIRSIRYGEVVITIHDAKVLQIEKKEKKRFHQKGGDVD